MRVIIATNAAFGVSCERIGSDFLSVPGRHGVASLVDERRLGNFPRHGCMASSGARSSAMGDGVVQ
jgi:hypothetical protein